MNRLNLLVMGALLFATGHHQPGRVDAFTPSGSNGSSPSTNSNNLDKNKLITSETTKLSKALQQVSSTSSHSIPSIVGEEDAHHILNRAREVAFEDENDPDYQQHYHPYKDEDAKLEEARLLLREMIHLQSACVTGALMGQDICQDQQVAAEIVARLRQKIDRLERRIAKRTGSDSMVPWIATELSVGALVLILGVFWLTLDMTQQHEVTLMNYLDFVGTAQEKGYLVNMFDIGSKL